MRSILDRPTVFALWLLLTMAAAFALRVVPGYRQVFPADDPGAVVFREVDPYYHARAIAHQAANFPERFAFDPYLAPPDGGDVPVAPLFDLVVAAVALGIGGGDPHFAETVAAWFPALAGALVILPVALLARRYVRMRIPLSDAAGVAGIGGIGGIAASAGALAAAILALQPSQLLARSLLGFADHHVLEVLLTTCLLVALAGALDGSRPARARVVSTVFAGLALAAYALVWVGAASILVLLAAWVVAQFVADLAAGRALDWLTRTALPVFALGAALTLPFYDGVVVARRNLLALGGLVALAALLALAVRSARWSAARRGRERAGPGESALWAAGIFALSAGLLAMAAPGLVALVRDEIGQLLGARAAAAVVREAAPLSTLGSWWQVTWSEFALAGFVALAALLVAAVRLVVRRGGAAVEMLLVVWTSGLVLLALRQNRFLYYLGVPVAVFAAAGLVELARRLLAAENEREIADAGGLADSPDPREARGRSATVAGALLFTGALLATTGFGLESALQRAQSWNGPTADWRAALSWLRAATPEPFGDASFYLRRVRRDDPARPRPAYSVAAWWDYGYWILHLGRRVPVANPTQAGASAMARLLLSVDDEETARALAAIGGAAVSEGSAGSAGSAARYLVLDSALPILFRDASGRPGGKLRSIAVWAGVDSARYVERVEQREADGSFKTYTIFHPDYYRTLLVRLYFHGGRAAAPGRAHIVELGAMRPSGLRELLGVETFRTGDEAAAALAGRDPERFALVSVDPATTPVPLPETRLFQPVWSSPTAVVRFGDRAVGEVEIFEHIGTAASEAP